MQTILEVHFNSLVKAKFRIVNPPIIPNTGDVVYFNFEELLSNKEDIQKLNDYLNNNILIAERSAIYYYNDRVEVTIILLEEKDFKHDYLKMTRHKMN
jgi:hypothetical protein